MRRRVHQAVSCRPHRDRALPPMLALSSIAGRFADPNGTSLCCVCLLGEQLLAPLWHGRFEISSC
jgi:hypothetical protein